MPDLWLTGDHFVSKLSAVGQPTRPTQPSISPGSVMSSDPWTTGVETIKTADCGYMVHAKVRERRLELRPKLNAGPVFDAERR